MITGSDFCRAMRPGEEAAVDDLLRRAFDGPTEAQLVKALRKSGAIRGEMVLPFDGGIAGYYALSEFRQPRGWLCLAPVAIDPGLQGRGNGRRMIGLLTEWARISGNHVVVLGQPEFYEKAGFSRTRAASLTSPYPVEYLLLAGPGTDAPTKTLIYPAAFENL